MCYTGTANEAQNRVKPRLQAAAGPLVDSTYLLTEDEARIERDPSNSLAISDFSLSRRQSMIGESSPMKEVYRFLSRVAPTDSTLLISGESGTGKELVARAIHRNGPRASRPFVAINCAAIPEGLLESELFGYERGAFTGAAERKKGRIEIADGGVVFLDEIGELAPALQVKLLRVLQEREFERLGAPAPSQ